jgi:hypothetical protein
LSKPVLMPSLTRLRPLLLIGTVLASTLSFGSGAAQAATGCGAVTETWTYTPTVAVEQASVQLAGCGTSQQVGTVQVEASVFRCAPEKCTGVASLTLCQPPTRVCVSRVALRHPRIEQASYGSGYDYSNDGTRRLSGSKSTTRQCVTAGTVARCFKS